MTAHAIPSDLRYLVALLDNAESADWSVECEPAHFNSAAPMFTVYSGRSQNRHGLNLFGRLTDCDSFGEQNLKLACAAVNALPGLIERIARLEDIEACMKRKYVTDARDAIADYHEARERLERATALLRDAHPYFAEMALSIASDIAEFLAEGEA